MVTSQTRWRHRFPSNPFKYHPKGNIHCPKWPIATEKAQGLRSLLKTNLLCSIVKRIKGFVVSVTLLKLYALEVYYFITSKLQVKIFLLFYFISRKKCSCPDFICSRNIIIQQGVLLFYNMLLQSWATVPTTEFGPSVTYKYIPPSQTILGVCFGTWKS